MLRNLPNNYTLGSRELDPSSWMCVLSAVGGWWKNLFPINRELQAIDGRELVESGDIIFAKYAEISGDFSVF